MTVRAGPRPARFRLRLGKERLPVPRPEWWGALPPGLGMVRGPAQPGAGDLVPGGRPWGRMARTVLAGSVTVP
jgi:hypothetical protein